MPNLLSTEVITSKIFVIRGKKVMIDRDLALNWKSQIAISNKEKMGLRKRFRV